MQITKKKVFWTLAAAFLCAMMIVTLRHPSTAAGPPIDSFKPDPDAVAIANGPNPFEDQAQQRPKWIIVASKDKAVNAGADPASTVIITAHEPVVTKMEDEGWRIDFKAGDDTPTTPTATPAP